MSIAAISRSGANARSPSSTGPAYIAMIPMTGWPRTGSGTNSSGGAVRNASAAPTSSGAAAMKSRNARTICPAICPGYMSIPPSTIGPISCRRKWNAVTTPKFPPPPRRPQKSSGFSSSEATTLRPSAVTTSARSRLSQAKPHLRSIQPLPLPSVKPPTPVPDMRPPVTARPCSCVAESISPQVHPPSTRAVRASASTSMPFIPRRSTHTPSAHTADARDPVAAAVDREREPVVTREADRGGDVVGVCAARDQRRAAVPHAVEHAPRVVVAVVAGAQQRALEIGKLEVGRRGESVGHVGGCSWWSGTDRRGRRPRRGRYYATP